MTRQKKRTRSFAHFLLLFVFLSGEPSRTESPSASRAEQALLPPVPVDRPPTPEEEAWVETHVRGAWNEIERNYPVLSVRKEFIHVMDRLRRQEVVPNISIAPNAASPDVNCSADFHEDGKQRMTFYLGALQRIHAVVDHETFKDVLLDCMVHENIHLEEQMLYQDPAASFTWEELALGEADAWCKTTDRVLAPLRAAGRRSKDDWGRQEALRIYDQVGADCESPLWVAFGRQMSPYPLGNYK